MDYYTKRHLEDESNEEPRPFNVVNRIKPGDVVECRLTSEHWIFVEEVDEETAKLRGRNYYNNQVKECNAPFVSFRTLEGKVLGFNGDITQLKEPSKAQKTRKENFILVGVFAALVIMFLAAIFL